jgi:polyisoprenoid-binding protein YceI
MKTIKMLATALVALVAVPVALAGKPGKPSTLKVDVAKSTVNWLAKKVTGQHNGTINVSAGEVLVEKGKLVGGTFTIDMKTIKCVDITNAEYNAKFVGHITNGDFFEVEKFPTASFKITKVANGQITGDMTIKGVTQSMSFPGTVTVNGNNVTASAKIEVDRTKFGIKYGSKSFFASIGDKAIDDIFTLDIALVTAAM